MEKTLKIIILLQLKAITNNEANREWEKKGKKKREEEKKLFFILF